ncbi:ANTAR domain-containing protein [Amycolatopsis alba]|uniref:Transcription antitermination regulator n=1 Tax=Amycolatopsis alba DSM 44262 TaxID=1125972 RepID=A0A229RIM6_AMYAL|nr:ANTAR domain-containing protein [Amycolatopsis alba]OXM46274.1 transcription antitermination regulator [Amycolatopsis alba DSM 44262]
MKDGFDGRYTPAAMRRFVEEERGRAIRAASRAERHEGLIETAGTEMRPFHRRMAGLHRDTERRHRASAELHATHADSLESWAARDSRTLPPKFMTAVAQASGSRSMTVTLLGRNNVEAAVASSDPIAEAAHDLEYVIGEGPSRTAMIRPAPLSVCGEEALTREWPTFGPAVRELGIWAVASARLGAIDLPLGALTAYRTGAEPDPVSARSVGSVAEVLTATALRLDEPSGDGLPPHPLFDEVDQHLVVHQATGAVMISDECTAADALALIRARAFVRNQSITEVALEIVARSRGLN